MIKIHDIKSLEIIPDYSMFYLVFLMVLAFLIIGFILRFFYLKIKKRDKLRKIYFNELKNINLTDTKKAAYLITKKARYLIKTDKEKELFKELENLLKEYKYKKEVSTFPKEFKTKFSNFMDCIHV